MMFKAFFFVLGLASFKNEESLMLTALFSILFFSGKPEMATINSSPEGLYRNSYNLTWSIKSSSPLEKVRILFRKMVSRYYVVYIFCLEAFQVPISCFVILKVTLINLVFDHERSLNNFNVSGLGNLIKTIGSVIDLKHATTS